MMSVAESRVLVCITNGVLVGIYSAFKLLICGPNYHVSKYNNNNKGNTHPSIAKIKIHMVRMRNQ